jgi:hypothetical protein
MAFVTGEREIDGRPGVRGDRVRPAKVTVPKVTVPKVTVEAIHELA